jgi:hypothetical protein
MQADFSYTLFILRNKALEKMDEEPPITLRDFFAGCALMGRLAGEYLPTDEIPKWAYRDADAMLEAREEE